MVADFLTRNGNGISMRRPVQADEGIRVETSRLHMIPPQLIIFLRLTGIGLLAWAER
jgi:hypothetical protein